MSLPCRPGVIESHSRSIRNIFCLELETSGPRGDQIVDHRSNGTYNKTSYGVKNRNKHKQEWHNPSIATAGMRTEYDRHGYQTEKSVKDRQDNSRSKWGDAC